MQTSFMARPLRTLLGAAVSALLAFALASSALAEELSANSRIYPATAKPFGKTYAEWTAKWWKWALALPVDGHPFDASGFDCDATDNGQSGPVWFVALSSSPPMVERSCTIPPGKAVLVSLANVECSSLEPTFPDGTGGQTEEERRACATFFANHVVVSSLFCTIDGKAVKHLGHFRFPSAQFTFTAPTPWIFGATGGTGKSVSDGYFVMLKPPAPGTHTASCGGTFHFSTADGDPFDADFGFGNAYYLTVMP